MNKPNGLSAALPVSLLAALILAGCDLLTPAPQNPAVTVAPPAPEKGTIAVYQDADGISLQSRPGDCAHVACFQLVRGKWRPLPKTMRTDLPLLSVGEPTGSAFSDALWHRIGATQNAVMINRQAGTFNLAERFDGLRIGLRQGAVTRYAVVYSVESGDFLKANAQCVGGQAADVAGETCARKVGDNLYIRMPDANVVTAGGTAWLLHLRADGSATLIDLFAAQAQPEHQLCAPGMLLDSAPAGDYQAALSPDLFVSRAVDPSATSAEKLTCFTSKPKR